MGKAPAVSLRAHGFTLIEILAVLIIVGVVTGLAVFSIHSLDGRSNQGQAAEKLAGLIQLAGENARIENIQYGLKIKPHHYEFLKFIGHAWVPVTGDPTLKGRDLPDGMKMSVNVRNPIHMPASATAPGTAATAETARAPATAGKAEAITPQIAILSTGEMTPFTLRLSAPGGSTYVLQGDGNGQIHVRPPGSASAPATLQEPASGTE